MVVKKRADRTAQQAKRRQADEIAKQLDRDSLNDLDQLDLFEEPRARTGVPGMGMQPLTDRHGPQPKSGGAGRVHSR